MLACILSAALVAGVLSFFPGIVTPARAQDRNEFRVATWNMHNGAQGKWTEAIPRMLDEEHLNVLSLQEHNDPNFFEQRPAMFTRIGQLEQLGTDPNDRLGTYTFRNPTNGRTYYVYVLQRTNIAHRTRVIVTDRAADELRATPATAGPNSPRPAFGVRLGRTWLYNIHADSRANQLNDAPNLLEGIRTAHPNDPWITMGDFNVEPLRMLRDWDAVGPDEIMLSTGQQTQQNTMGRPEEFPPGSRGNEYDYAVANRVRPTDTPWTSRDYTGSDHYPVFFRFTALQDADGPLHTLRHQRDQRYIGVSDREDGRHFAEGSSTPALSSTFQESGSVVVRGVRFFLLVNPLSRRCLGTRSLVPKSSAGDEPALELVSCATDTPPNSQLWRFDENGALRNADDRAVWSDDASAEQVLRLGPAGKEQPQDTWEHCSWNAASQSLNRLELTPVSCSHGSAPPPALIDAPRGIDASFVDLSGAGKDIRFQLFSAGRTATLRFDPDKPEAADTLTPSRDFPEPENTFLQNADAAVSTLSSLGDGTFLVFGKDGRYARMKPGARGMVDATVAVADQPKPIGDAFHALRGTVFEHGVDAVFDVPGELALRNEVYLFKGDQYARMAVDLGGTGDKITNGPLSIADNWGDLKDKAPEFTRDLDSAFMFGEFAYLFKGDKYVKIKITPEANADRVVEGPARICARFKSLCGTVFDGEVVKNRGDLEMQQRAGHKSVGGQAPAQPGGVQPVGGRFATLTSAAGPAADLAGGNTAPGTRVLAWDPEGTKPNQQWALRDLGGGGTWQLGTASAPNTVLDRNMANQQVVVWGADPAKENQQWELEPGGQGWYALHSAVDQNCLTASGKGADLTVAPCDASAAQWWKLSFTTPPAGAGDPFDAAPDQRVAKPPVSGSQAQCRPDGMAATAGVDARYCDVYDAGGREWLGGAGHDKRVVGYFTGWRTGAKGDPRYLVKNIPWSKVTHLDYAFAGVVDNKISIGNTEDPTNPATGMTWPGVAGAEMDPSLPYRGHFNQLAKYKKLHPQVKSLISVGGWADTKGFYAMAGNADGSVNQAGIDTFADSMVGFLDRFKDAFDGVDIDYEYPTALPQTGNPNDWDLADPRRKGLQAGYTALMKTLRAKLDRAGADRGRYYLLTSAGSGSGYLVRGYDAGSALQYQDFVNVMSYDLHGSWNNFVGPQAPLYDDGRDNELAAAGVYNDTDPNTKDYRKTGYFNVDWAYHYYRGALPPGRINLGIPYYTRGWQNVSGGTDGLWGTAALPDQKQCRPGTGITAPCGSGAVGVDNVWHDSDGRGGEVAAGSNPLWHARNLQNGITPSYLSAYTDTSTEAGRLRGTYQEKYDPTLQASWLWNADKKVFLSTENDASIDAKTQYVKDNAIGGVMLWELAGDYTGGPGGQYGMGYDVTTRIDNALRNSGTYQADRAGATRLPDQVVDVRTELVDFPTDAKDMWSLQPTLRITNNTGTALVRGTEIAFDLPTSTPPVVKDGAWQPLTGLTPGRGGPNVGGLKADFHRLTITLEYCQDIAPGKSMDIPLKYYLPITGITNTVIRMDGKEYGTTGDLRRNVGRTEPPAVTGAECRAPQWDASRKNDKTRPYGPTVGRTWTAWDKGSGTWQLERGDGIVMDHNTREHRVGLWPAQDGNGNQAWKANVGDGGWYSLENGGLCMTAGDIAGDVTTTDCDRDNVRQHWWFVDTDPNTGVDGGTGAPRHGRTFKLRADNGTYAESATGATAPDTHIVSGDRAGATTGTVWWNGSYWRAEYWTMGEPGNDPAWLRIAARS
ncbi:glycosyl hydrolase family 18 protein [Embleya sp. AB8]|uniref:glycosyl hydrolase family 18 protein n=1 Tax=Embleya sp. AB8 TaxID=3156304 RepID=UPI003C7353C2